VYPHSRISRVQPTRRGDASRPLLVLLCLLIALSQAVPAAGKHDKELSVEGTLAAVAAAKVTVHPAEGADISIVCKEDFRESVAPGSKVTAWYVVKDGVNTLTWLEYPPQSFFAPPEEIRQSFKKVIILPDYGVANSEVLVGKIADYISQNLGWYVAPAALGQEIARRVKRTHSTLEDIDPGTGEFSMESYRKLQHAVIERCVSEARVDGVLEVRVVRVQAPLIDNYANWDGVEENIAGKGVRALSRLTHYPQNGEVPAATVIMKLWNSQGRLLWSCRRGFAALVVHTGLGNDFQDRPLTEVYERQAAVSQWLADTLGTWALPKNRPAATETPASAKKTKE